MKTPNEFTVDILTLSPRPPLADMIAARDAEVRAAAVEECAQAVCPMCATLSPVVRFAGVNGYYHDRHGIPIDCKASPIRALAKEPPR